MATPESAQQQDNRLDTLQYRFSHASEQRFKNMACGKLATGFLRLKRVQLWFCEACIMGKMQRKAFRALRGIRSTRRQQLVHSDVCGLMPTESISGNRYFVTFVDDYSRFCAVYFLKRGAEVPEMFKLFEGHVANDSC